MAAVGARAGFLVAAFLACLVMMGGPYAGTAHACSCVGSSNVAAAYRGADAVFAGEMVRGGIEDPDPEDGIMIGGIQFRVIDAWKGVPGESMVLYGQDVAYYGELEEGEMVVSSSCAYVFERGERYLVYASRYEDGLQTGACDRTAPLAEAEKDLDALGPPANRLTETGGLPLPLSSALVAAAAFSISCGVLFRWVRS